MLTIGNPATINAGKRVMISGNLLMQAPLSIQAGGTLAIASGGATLLGVPALDAGASVDVQHSSMSISYAGDADPADTVRQQLASGFVGGGWNGAGINTSWAIVGKTGLGWKDDAADKSIIVMYASYGDANLDGTVDTSDFVAMARNFNSGTGVWSSGDFNYDGVVNAMDFNALASNFGSTASAQVASSVVPEPASGVTLMAIGACSLLRFGRRSFSKMRSEGA
jgi:hypothetical protein